MARAALSPLRLPPPGPVGLRPPHSPGAAKALPSAFDIQLVEVQRIPLHSQEKVQVVWQYEHQSGSSRVVSVGKDGTAVFNLSFALRLHPPTTRQDTDAAFLHFCLQHRPSGGRPPLTIDKLALNLRAMDVCGTMGISSAKMTVFTLFLAAQAHRIHAETPTGASPPLSPSKPDIDVEALKLRLDEAEKQLRDERLKSRVLPSPPQSTFPAGERLKSRVLPSPPQSTGCPTSPTLPPNLARRRLSVAPLAAIGAYEFPAHDRNHPDGDNGGRVSRRGSAQGVQGVPARHTSPEADLKRQPQDLRMTGNLSARSPTLIAEKLQSPKLPPPQLVVPEEPSRECDCIIA